MQIAHLRWINGCFWAVHMTHTRHCKPQATAKLRKACRGVLRRKFGLQKQVQCISFTKLLQTHNRTLNTIESYLRGILSLAHEPMLMIGDETVHHHHAVSNRWSEYPWILYRWTPLPVPGYGHKDLLCKPIRIDQNEIDQKIKGGLCHACFRHYDASIRWIECFSNHSNWIWCSGGSQAGVLFSCTCISTSS